MPVGDGRGGAVIRAGEASAHLRRRSARPAGLRQVARSAARKPNKTRRLHPGPFPPSAGGSAGPPWATPWGWAKVKFIFKSHICLAEKSHPAQPDVLIVISRLERKQKGKPDSPFIHSCIYFCRTGGGSQGLSTELYLQSPSFLFLFFIFAFFNFGRVSLNR